jgi:two-component system, chemotaxis family, chemotaxis protein CheY
MPSAIIVDDSPIMRAQLRKLLGSAGFSVVAEAGTAERLLALYEEHRPDLITLDIVMPGRDGADAAVSLLEAYPEATITICTSLGSRERIDMCRRAGVKYYLLKPFTPEFALAIFHRVLEKHPVAARAERTGLTVEIPIDKRVP